MQTTICILAHNCEDTIAEAIESSLGQGCDVCVMENGSTDNTLEVAKKYKVSINSIKENIDMTQNIRRCFKLDTDYIILLCGDDVFVEKKYGQDVTDMFNSNPKLNHISRYYYQFLDGDDKAVRVWRSNNIYKLADNPSGLAFRIKRVGGGRKKPKALDKPFVEVASIVHQFLNKEHSLVPYDAIGVRVGTNSSKEAKSFRFSPLESWVEAIGKQEFLFKDYLGFVQIKCWGGQKKLIEEIKLFIKYRKKNLITPAFWFFALGTLIVPSKILAKLALAYKRTRNCKIIRRSDDFNSNSGL